MNRATRGAGVAAFGLLFALGCGAVRAADEPELLYTLAAEKGGSITGAQFSSNGKRLFTWGTNPTLAVWDAETGKTSRAIELAGVRAVHGLSGDGGRALVTGAGGVVAVWDVAECKQLVELKPGPKEKLAPYRLSPDGERAVTVTDKTAKVWEVKTGKVLGTCAAHEGPIASAEFSADGTRVATGSYHGEIRVWDAETGKELLSLAGMSTSNNPTMFSADGKLLVSPRFESPAVWSAKDGKLVQEFKGHKGWCRSARFDPAGARIVTTGQDGTTRVWDVKTGNVLYSLKHEGDFGSADFSPDGARVFAVTGGNVRVWQLPKEK